MKNKNNITFIIFTKNEEKRISYPIKCFLPYGNVVVSDDSSEDDTVKIAKNLGAKVIKRKTHLPFVENKKEADFIFKKIKTDWVFWGFADDLVPKKCLELYHKISIENKYKVVVQKRKTLMYDIRSELHPGFVSIKFFRKDSIDFSNNKIHEMGNFSNHVKPEEVLYLPQFDEYSTYHFSKETTTSLMSKINFYTTFEAEKIKVKINLFKIVVDPIKTFIITYFLGGAWKHGVKGYVSSLRFAIGTFVIMAKKYELDNQVTLDSIEKKFKPLKSYLLKKSPKSNLFKKAYGYFLGYIISLLHKKYKFKK